MTYEEQAKEFTKAHEQFYELQILPTTIARQLEENAYACGCKNTERALALTWQDIRMIVKIADDLLDDPNARVAFQNHNEEYYYKRVLEQYNNSKDEANSVD